LRECAHPAQVIQQAGVASANTLQVQYDCVPVRSDGQNLDIITQDGVARTDNPLSSEISNILNHENVSDKQIHPNIQHDMELWQRVREYDQCVAEIPFTPVLSKKQKQKLKQAHVLGKPTYRTRSAGEASPLPNEYIYIFGMLENASFVDGDVSRFRINNCWNISVMLENKLDIKHQVIIL